MKTSTAMMIALLAAAGGTQAAQPLGCLIEPMRVAEVGSPVVGVLDTVQVERGERVAKGQVLAVLRNDVERAALSVAHTRAQAEADEAAAAAAVTFAKQKMTRSEDLFNQKFISSQALDQSRTELDLAEQKLAQTREQKRISGREMGLVSAQLAQRTIRSPIAGVVAERYLSAGERVEEKPVVRVAQIDPLKVLVVVPVAHYGKIKSGATAKVTPQLPNAAPVQAKVTLVDQVIDAPSNTFRVQLELPNGDMALPAGLRCMADFGFDMSVPRTAQVPATPAAQLPAKPAGVQPASLKLEPKPVAARTQ